MNPSEQIPAPSCGSALMMLASFRERCRFVIVIDLFFAPFHEIRRLVAERGTMADADRGITGGIA